VSVSYGGSGYGGAGMSQGGMARQSHYGRGPRNFRRSDERIREEINERLTRHPEIDASDVDVQVNNGEVTLSGVVEDRTAKRLAEDLTEEIYGVTDVQNQLKVRHGFLAGLMGEKADESDREVHRSASREGSSSAMSASGSSGSSSMSGSSASGGSVGTAGATSGANRARSTSTPEHGSTNKGSGS
jgi:hypothetical protein